MLRISPSSPLKGLEERSRRVITCLALVVAVVPSVASATSAADDHLLAGADHFRSGRFNEALVEFKVAERLGGEGDATWYAAATLARLGRAEDATAQFVRAAQVAPQAGGPLFSYYRAVAAYEARLYLTARTLLRELIARSGPRIAAEARKLQQQIEPMFRSAPQRQTVDWYLARGLDALRQNNAPLASAFLEEAAALGALRDDRYRSAEVQAALGQLRR